MPHLACETSFLLLFVFLIISILHHHPALLHCHALILDHSLIFLVAFSTLISKPSFSQSLSHHSHLALSRADLLELWTIVVKLAQLVFSAHYTLYLLTYLEEWNRLDSRWEEKSRSTTHYLARYDLETYWIEREGSGQKTTEIMGCPMCQSL